MLFEEGERRRQGRLAGAPRAENRPPPQPPQPQPQPQPIHHQAPPRYEPPAIPFWQPRGDVLSRFDWMLDGGMSAFLLSALALFSFCLPFNPTKFKKLFLRSAHIHRIVGLKGGRQFFTKNMIATLTCQYCFARLTSLADLRYHLSHTTKHPVYACCGRFFKTEADFQKHATMKWGDHENQVTRLLDE